MIRKTVVLGVAFLLAIGAVAAIAHLQMSADASHHAQLRLVGIGNALADLEELPWEADPEEAGPAQVRADMRAVERRIERALDDLPGGVADSRLATARDRYEASLAPLDKQRRLVARDAPDASEPADVAETRLDGVHGALDEAAADFEGREENAEREAIAGSAAVVLLLFSAFGVFYLRATKARDGLSRALASLDRAQRARSRLLAQTVRSAEQERTRIAAELHDGPIQHLSSLGFILDRARRRLQAGSTAMGLEQLDRAREDLTADIVELRRLMSQLRPPVLDQGGLESAIRDYAGSFARKHGVAVEVRSDLDGAELAPEIETVIYRVTQESLSNVAKHAGAEHVRMRVRSQGEGVELKIVDDGSGFDPAALPRHLLDDHYGVMGMRERVENAGGRWELRSSPGTGTAVRATLPALPRGSAGEPEPALALAAS